MERSNTFQAFIGPHQRFAVLVGAFFALCTGFAGAYAGITGMALVVVAAFGILASLAILRRPWFGVMMLTIALPLERFGSVELAGLTVRASQIFGAITLVAFLLGLVIARRMHLAAHPGTLPLAAFLTISFLSLSQAENVMRGALVLFFIAFTVLVHYLLPNLITTTERLRAIVRTLLIVTGVIGTFGLFQFFGDMIGLPTSITGLRDLYTSDVFGFPRVQSTFLEPLYFANFLLIPIGLLLAYLFSHHRPLRLVWLYPLLGLVVLNLILTLSRGGYIGLVVTALVIGLYSVRKALKPSRLFFGAVLIVAVGYAFLQIFSFTGQQDIFLGRFVHQATDIFSGASFFDREATFRQAYDLFRTHPWIGIGIGNFGPAIAIHPLQQPIGGWLIVNNEFLEILAETGILGLIAFLSFLATLFFRSVQALRSTPDSFEKQTLVGLFGAFLGILVQYQTFSILFIMHIWFLFGLLVATQNIVMREKEHNSV